MNKPTLFIVPREAIARAGRSGPIRLRPLSEPVVVDAPRNLRANEETQRWQLPEAPPRRDQSPRESTTTQYAAWGATLCGMFTGACVMWVLHEAAEPAPNAGLAAWLLVFAGLATGGAVFLIKSKD